MAESKSDKTTTATGTASAADVQRSGSQPEVGSVRREPDRTTASPDAARAAVMASAAPSADRVVMVSRDVNGEPAQSDNFHVMVPADAPEHVVDAHWNRAGEALGAKHVTEADHEALGNWDTGFSEKEQTQRAETERRELHRHNFREDVKS